MFLELNDINGYKVAININHIIKIWENGDSCGIDTSIDNHGFSIYVNESYKEVYEKLGGYNNDRK